MAGHTILWYVSHRQAAKAQEAQTRQSLCCLHMRSVDVDEGSNQYLDLLLCCIRHHVCSLDI